MYNDLWVGDRFISSEELKELEHKYEAEKKLTGKSYVTRKVPATVFIDLWNDVAQLNVERSIDCIEGLMIKPKFDFDIANLKTTIVIEVSDAQFTINAINSTMDY